MQLLLAPAGRGKTTHVVTRIREVCAAEPLAPIWVILPNQEQVRAFQRRLAQAGGALGVEINTFYGVYARVLALGGAPIPRLFEPVQYRLLRAAVDSLHAEGALLHYAPLREKPGFLRRLRELILELKQARVEPDELGAAVAEGPTRLTELAAIYRRYQDWLQTTGWADAEGQGWLAAVALEKSDALCRDIRLLAVDRFDEFNPTQLAVLRLLAQRSHETIVTLVGEMSDRPRDAHRRFIRARDALCAHCHDVEIGPLPHISERPAPVLDHLEKRLFAASIFTPQPPSPALSLIEARDRAEEVRAALRWLKETIVLRGAAPHETAVLARNLEPYRPYLAEVAAEYGLPLHISGGEMLGANPAIAALLNLLSLPLRDWPQREVLDAWRSPYFDWSSLLEKGAGHFERIEQAAGRLAEVVRGARIISGENQWREALTRRSQVQDLEDLDSDEEGMLREGPLGEEAAALLHMFTAFVQRLQPPEPASLETYIGFVEDLLGEDPQAAGRFESAEAGDPSLRVVAQARANVGTAERDVAALRAFKDVLRGLLLAERIAASVSAGSEATPMSYSRFYSELRGAVEAASYRLPQPQQGAILAASVLQARGLSFRAAALLGLSEGEFPQREQEDPLLRDDERLALQARGVRLRPRLQGDEITLFYEAVTRARERLLVTRPYLTADGQPWEASPYWEEIRRLVAIAPTRADARAAPASRPEYLVVAGTLAGEEASFAEDWRQVQHAARVLAARQTKYARGHYEGDVSAIAARLQAHYPPGHVWSSSRLESYAVCPFQFFVRSGLGLEPRTEAVEGYDVLILGSIYHAVLEEIYRRARDQGDCSEAALLALLPEVAAPIFDAAPRRYGFRPTSLWGYQRQELLGVLERTLVGLAQVAGEYEPLALEKAFGLEGNPPLEIKRAEGLLRLRGFIDRIDQAPDGRLRIIDYKSGSTKIGPSELTEGARIQLPLYALAAERALGMGEVRDGFYWHIASASASRLTLEKYDGGVQGALATAVQHAFSHVQGIRSGRFQPKAPAKGCPASCPATGFCWRYRK